MMLDACPIRPLPGFIAVAASLAACTASPTQPARSAPPVPAMDSLVSTAWLAEHLGAPDLVVLDCSVTIEPDEKTGFRILNGRASYDAGHIPTAGFADLMGPLSDEKSQLRFAVPSPAKFAAAMNALGVDDETRVVLYDDSNSAWAARVWWMLRWIGFDRAALLDGGLRAWKAEDRPLSSDPAPPRMAGTLSISLRPDLIVDQADVRHAIGDDSVHIIDALSEASYRGDFSMYARPGHIAGATNTPMTALFDDSGRLKDENALLALIGDDFDERAITYCGGGIAASANAFVMTRLGFTDVAVYAASLQEWAADPSNPMETAPDVGVPGDGAHGNERQ